MSSRKVFRSRERENSQGKYRNITVMTGQHFFSKRGATFLFSVLIQFINIFRYVLFEADILYFLCEYSCSGFAL